MESVIEMAWAIRACSGGVISRGNERVKQHPPRHMLLVCYYHKVWKSSCNMYVCINCVRIYEKTEILLKIY